MLTGDLGRLDDAGRLLVEGRVDDMIISGGENVYPAEVEAVLGDAPRRGRGRGDRRTRTSRSASGCWRTSCCRPGADADAQHLRTHVRDQLANYKVPREIVVLDELPRNASGKVVKKELPQS